MRKSSITSAPGTWRPMIRLAAPVLGEETLTLMVTWTDWYLTGRYLMEGGDAVKAAMGLMGYTMWLIPSLFAAIAIGATAIIARRVGEADFRAAQHTANQAIMLGMLFAIAITALTFWHGLDFVAAMQLEGQAAQYAHEYLWIIVPVIPLIMLEQVGAACLRGAGDTVTGLVAKLVVVVVNVAVSLTLVVGLFGVEPIGWQGIAWGTAIGHACGGTILLMALIFGRYGLKLNRAMLRPQADILKRLLKVGLPGGFDVATLLFSNLVFVAVINSLGTAAAAAHGLAVQIEACAFLPANAFHVAAATLTGQFLGAGLPAKAQRGALLCIGSSVVVISFTALAMYFGGSDLAAWFTGQPGDATTVQVAQLLKVIAWALPSLSIVMVTTGALRGAGDTVWPLLITMSGFFLIRIPLAIFFSMDTIELPYWEISIRGMGWGVSGAWIAMAIDLFTRSGLVLWRFFLGTWKKKQI